MRHAAADYLGNLGKDVSDVQRACHRVQQTVERIDPLAAYGFGTEQRVVLEGQRQQIGDAVHHRFVGGAEGIGGTRREPERSVHAGATTDRADDP